jgi:hypothetical protein
MNLALRNHCSGNIQFVNKIVNDEWNFAHYSKPSFLALKPGLHRRGEPFSAAHEQAGRSPIFDEVIRHRDLFFIVSADFQWGRRGVTI